MTTKDSSTSVETNEASATMPTFSDKLKGQLPFLLRNIVKDTDSPAETDMLLLGALTTLSSCLPNVRGIYDQRNVHPNLFLFVTAKASSGKGKLSLCQLLVEPIERMYENDNIRKWKEYDKEMLLREAGEPKPDKPTESRLFIPANSSATAVFQTLGENDSKGLIFETEGDTLSRTFKTGHGNYSDGFRKAFHHERISYLRRKNNESVVINHPQLSVVLSGTPQQISTLIPDAENGLFSRFIFYYMETSLEWKNVFGDPEDGPLDCDFEASGEMFFEFYQKLKEETSIKFLLTQSQEQKFNQFFESHQAEYAAVFGPDIVASVRRLGLIAFRIAMIITMLRVMDGKKKLCDDFWDNSLPCDDADLDIALTIVNVLLPHTAKVLSMLKETQSSNIISDNLLNLMPEEFSREEYMTAAMEMGIKPNTANLRLFRQTKNKLLKKTGYGRYMKIKG